MYTGQKINVQKVMGLIPDDLLSTLSKDTKVDYCAKVLYGQRIFNLLLYGILTTDRTSQRTLEDLFKSDLFKAMFCYDAGIKVSHSSISTRLSKIDSEFFRLVYENIYKEFSKFFTVKEQLKYRIVRVDSSMVAETCNKLRKGFPLGIKKVKTPENVVKQVKYTVAFDGLTACDFKVFTEPSYLSEDWAIPEVVRLNASKEGSNTNIYTFDRGVTCTKTFSSFNKDEISFVGRLRIPRKYDVVALDQVSENDKDLGELTLISSQLVHLYDGDCKIDHENIYRLIIAERKEKIDITPPDNKGKFRKKVNTFYVLYQ